MFFIATRARSGSDDDGQKVLPGTRHDNERAIFPPTTTSTNSEEKKEINPEVSISSNLDDPHQEPSSKAQASATPYEFASSDPETSALDPKLNAQLLRRQDLCVCLPIGLMFLLSFIDRSNLGNAYTAGMGADAHFPPNGLNVATTIFYPTYVIFEPVSAIVFRRVGARKMLTSVCIGWGTITIVSGFCTGVNGYKGFLACRVLLGVVESSFFPACALYLTYFYRREVRPPATISYPPYSFSRFCFLSFPALPRSWGNSGTDMLDGGGNVGIGFEDQLFVRCCCAFWGLLGVTRLGHF